MTLDAETISAILGAIGLSSIVAATINAISNRKKTGADATKIITDAALDVVTQLQDRIKDLLAEVEDLRARQDETDRKNTSARRALRKHHEWDLELVRVINKHLPTRVDLLPPPPLLEDEPEFQHEDPKKMSWSFSTKTQKRKR